MGLLQETMLSHASTLYHIANSDDNVLGGLRGVEMALSSLIWIVLSRPCDDRNIV